MRFLGRLIPSLACSAVLMKPETIEMRLLLPDFAEQRNLLCYGKPGIFPTNQTVSVGSI